MALCFPALSASERQTIVRHHFEDLGAWFAEIGASWFGNPKRFAGMFRIEGVEHLHAALQRGNGVIAFSGHFMTFEICAPNTKMLVPEFAFMYSPRGNALLNEIQLRGRERAAHVSFSSDDVRSMLKALRRNAVVWYAPDQARGAGCEDVSFFGLPIEMSTATSRIARVSGAAVVPFFFCRHESDKEYLLRFEPALEDFPTDDAIGDTQRLTAILERFVRETPAQYLWNYKKFAR